MSKFGKCKCGHLLRRHGKAGQRYYLHTQKGMETEKCQEFKEVGKKCECSKPENVVK